MESVFDTIKPTDEVTTSIYGPEGDLLYQATAAGMHSIEEEIQTALANAALQVSPEDCVFEVHNMTSGVSHRYRLNAHGHLKRIL